MGNQALRQANQDPSQRQLTTDWAQKGDSVTCHVHVRTSVRLCKEGMSKAWRGCCGKMRNKAEIDFGLILQPEGWAEIDLGEKFVHLTFLALQAVNFSVYHDHRYS